MILHVFRVDIGVGEQQHLAQLNVKALGSYMKESAVGPYPLIDEA